MGHRNGQRYCRKCGELKETNNFEISPRSNNYYGYCKACRAAKRKYEFRGPENTPNDTPDGIIAHYQWFIARELPLPIVNYKRIRCGACSFVTDNQKTIIEHYQANHL